MISMSKTTLSTKGQVVIPKQIREKLGLTPGTVFKIRLEGKSIILEPITEPPNEIFVEARPEVTEPILEEAKSSSDKTRKLLKDLGVPID